MKCIVLRKMCESCMKRNIHRERKETLKWMTFLDVFSFPQISTFRFHETKGMIYNLVNIFKHFILREIYERAVEMLRGSGALSAESNWNFTPLNSLSFFPQKKRFSILKNWHECTINHSKVCR